MNPLGIALLIGAAIWALKFVPIAIAAGNLQVSFRTISNVKLLWPVLEFRIHVEIFNPSNTTIILEYIHINLKGIGQSIITGDTPELRTILTVQGGKINKIWIPVKINIVSSLAKFIPGLISSIIEAASSGNYKAVFKGLPDIVVELTAKVPGLPAASNETTIKLSQLANQIPDKKQKEAAA